jgi:hypothetical protein
MPSVVQARCPGCRKVLRIPAEWLQQTIRCKHCGTAVQAQPPAPPIRRVEPAPVPPPLPAARVSGIADRVPMVEAVSENPFNGLGGPEAAPADDDLSFADPAAPIIRTAHVRRRSRVGRWLALAAFVLFLGGLATAGFLALPHLEQLRQKLLSEQQVKAPEHPANPEHDPLPADAEFPRRALLVSVNNYLYANPVSYGTSEKNLRFLRDRLARVLHIPRSQIVELSDAAAARATPSFDSLPSAKKKSGKRPAPEPLARPPLKPVIEKTVSDFVDTCRAQDRILLFFLGHVVLIEDEAYLVPLEGELDVKETLIPLNWLYDRLTRCKARQKVLVVDTCRLDPGRGQERQGSGPMPAKLDALLAHPPAGVQVWSSCTSGQFSYELEGVGVFLDKLYDALEHTVRKKLSRPQEALPATELAAVVGPATATEIDGQLKEKQTPRLSGLEPAEGAPYDRNEAAPPTVAVALPPQPPGGTVPQAEIRSILGEIDVPPIKRENTETAPIQMEALIPFSAKVMEPYRADYSSLETIKASPDKYPLRIEILKVVKLLETTFERDNPAFTLIDFFPGGKSDKIKADIEQKQRGPAAVERKLRMALQELERVREEQGKDRSKRWQAHYDYIHAQLLARIVYVTEYNLLLGKIRLEDLPMTEGGAPAGGYRLASREKLTSGKEARDMLKKSQTILKKVSRDHKGTPWELLAKREVMTAVGLEWRAVR